MPIKDGGGKAGALMEKEVSGCVGALLLPLKEIKGFVINSFAGTHVCMY